MGFMASINGKYLRMKKIMKYKNVSMNDILLNCFSVFIG